MAGKGGGGRGGDKGKTAELWDTAGRKGAAPGAAAAPLVPWRSPGASADPIAQFRAEMKEKEASGASATLAREPAPAESRAAVTSADAAAVAPLPAPAPMASEGSGKGARGPAVAGPGVAAGGVSAAPAGSTAAPFRAEAAALINLGFIEDLFSSAPPDPTELKLPKPFLPLQVAAAPPLPFVLTRKWKRRRGFFVPPV